MMKEISNMLWVAEGNAEAFFILEKRFGSLREKIDKGEQVFRDDFYIICPIIMTGSFSCEMYLKILLKYEEINYKKEHSLYELFNKLKPATKEEVLNTYGDEEFIEKLKKYQDTFIKWRYFFEEDPEKSEDMFITIEPGFFEKFIKVLQKITFERGII